MKALRELTKRLREHFKIYLDFDSGNVIFKPRVKIPHLKPIYKVPMWNFRPPIRKNEPYMRRNF